MVVAIFLAFFYAYVAFLFVAPPAVGAVLITVGLRGSKRIFIVAGIACAVFPEVYYFLDPHLSSLANQSRAASLASLPRVKLADDDTRTLVIRSYLTNKELTRLLQTGGIDRIVEVNNHRDLFRPREPDLLLATTVVTASRAPGCQTLTYKLWAEKRHSFNESRAASCVSTTSEHLRHDELLGMDAVVYAADNETSLVRPGTIFGGGAYEMRHRHEGRDDLIAYTEDVKVERQISPFCLPVMPCLQPIPHQGIDRLKFILESLARS
jgi:hypothetical protein